MRAAPVVLIGQVWEDADPRAGGRLVKVVAIEKTHAHVQRTWGNGETRGRVTRIRLDRFRPTNSGYRLVKT